MISLKVHLLISGRQADFPDSEAEHWTGEFGDCQGNLIQGMIIKPFVTERFLYNKRLGKI